MLAIFMMGINRLESEKNQAIETLLGHLKVCSQPMAKDKILELFSDLEAIEQFSFISWPLSSGHYKYIRAINNDNAQV